MASKYQIMVDAGFLELAEAHAAMDDVIAESQATGVVDLGDERGRWIVSVVNRDSAAFREVLVTRRQFDRIVRNFHAE